MHLAKSDQAEVAHSTLTVPTLVLLPLSIGLPLAYIYFDKPYFLSNLIALCLGTAALALLKLDSFATAGLLLGVLLIYDIFWVRQATCPLIDDTARTWVLRLMLPAWACHIDVQ